MDLAAWLRQQIAINGGATHILRDGVEVPLDIEEFAAEIDRRLDGLTFHPRLIVDSRSPGEALSSARAEISLGLEGLRQSTTETRMPVEISLKEWPNKPRPGRPKTDVGLRVLHEMYDGINAGKWTAAELKNDKKRWTQGAFESEFRCHHSIAEEALALILG